MGGLAVPTLTLDPVARAAGTVRLPGSKSISNRALLLSGLARGSTRLLGVLDADDTRVMVDALNALGVNCSGEGSALRVDGAGGAFPVGQADLFLGNAGTAFRPLTAALALGGGEYVLRGVPRMHERPIGDLVDALRELGARIDYLGQPGYPPLAIHRGSPAAAAPVRVRGDVSSQFLTALLLALPLLRDPVRVEVVGDLISKPYVGLTLNLMRRYGVEVSREGWSGFSMPGTGYVSPGELYVEGDASSASYFLAAGAIGGGPVRVEGVGEDSIQGDVAFVDVLRSMGAQVETGPNWISCSAAGRLRAVDLDLNHIPDAAMTVAMLALFADGVTTIRNIGSWRVKETDRLSAMRTELRKLGAVVEAGDDVLTIAPPQRWRGAIIDTYDDHRMAMCCSLACLGGVSVSIRDPDCVRKTFPEYFQVLATILRAS